MEEIFLSAPTLPFLGKEYLLQINKSLRKPSVRLTADALSVNLYAPSPLKEPLLKAWYLRQAKFVLTQKTDFWGRKIGAQIKRIAIKDQRTRWGSCSSLGNINYNWRIIMAPEHVVDYLVVHEVSHRIYLNHSKMFWDLVGAHCPDYQDQKLWLKENSRRLFQVL